MRRPRRAALGLALPGFTRPASLVWNIPLSSLHSWPERGGRGESPVPSRRSQCGSPCPRHWDWNSLGPRAAILMPLVPGQCPPRPSLFGVRGSVGEGSEGCCSRGRGLGSPLSGHSGEHCPQELGEETQPRGQEAARSGLALQGGPSSVPAASPSASSACAGNTVLPPHNVPFGVFLLRGLLGNKRLRESL